MHQARAQARPIADRARSYPDGQLAVRVDDTDTYQLHAAARELEALMLHEQARHLAEVRAMLAELHRRDGVAIQGAELDAQADHLALLERGDRFLQDVATRLHPDSELLELARQLDDHALGVWREAAASFVDDCPPSLAQLRWRVEEEQRAELRSHAHLVRTEAHLGAQRHRYRLILRLWRHRRVVELRDELADCHTRRERSQRRLAHLDAKLQVIDNTEHARAAWITHAREVLVRGVAAAQVFAEREQHHLEQPHDHGQKAAAGPPPAVHGGRVRLGAVS
jgi:hypothetical protein